MRTALFLAILLATPILAGCLGGEADRAVAPDSEDRAARTDADGRLTRVGLDLPDANATEDELAERTLDAAPQWQLGEWWRVRLTEEFAGATYEGVRVVAGTEGDQFLVGMPRDDFANELMVLHVPGFGQVARADLSFEIHDVLFEPLKFPLEPGRTWATSFEGRPVTAEVTATEGTRAEVELLGDNDHILVTYDAAVGAIVRMAIDGYATYEVIDHDFGHRGTVTVPHMHDVIFQHGRFAGAARIGAASPEPGAPVETVVVDATYDRVSFVIIVGSIIAQAPGYYEETVTAPNGEAYQATMLPSDGVGLGLSYHRNDEPAGEWNFQHVAIGPGIAMAEGIAYHVYDVELPSGRILPSTGVHEHGS